MRRIILKELVRIESLEFRGGNRRVSNTMHLGSLDGWEGLLRLVQVKKGTFEETAEFFLHECCC